jgi:anhydro-N-acetylmuramic acid kinase
MSFELNGTRIAYDIGIANMILNYLTEMKGILYDDKGAIARSGKINNHMLSQLDALDYYQKPFPKSTGIEWFKDKIIPILKSNKDNFENSLHTAIHHISNTIAIDIKKYASKKENSLLVTGGGALNDFMMQTLQVKLGSDIKLHLPSKVIIDYKEALIFALMGVLRDRNEINTLSSVTGASSDSVGGVIFYPSNKYS